MISLARDPQSNGPVKRRELGAALVDLGEAAAAAEFDELISNGSERRTLGIACLNRLARQVSDDDALSLVVRIYQAVRDPQRRNLRDHAAALGLAIAWPQVEPVP